MKQMERDVAEKDKYFSSLVNSNKLNRVSLSYKMNDALQKSFNEIRKVGQIIVNSHSSEVAVVRKKETQAQTVADDVRSMSFKNLKFVLQSTLDTELAYICGCTLLPDGRLVFSCYGKKLVRGFNRDGSHSFDISLQPTRSFDITYIPDKNCIAVTSGQGSRCISIIDLESRKLKETIRVQSDNYGIVSRHSTLIYYAQNAHDYSLLMMNLTDKTEKVIATSEKTRKSNLPVINWPNFLGVKGYIDTNEDKLYYTSNKTRSVICCDLHGTVQWEFKDRSVLSYPHGISVDNTGNVYVIGWKSYNVVVISPDGQRHRQLLSNKDGLVSPNALHYDRSTNQLLVANETGKAFLFRLE